MPTFRESINPSLSEEECANETGLPILNTIQKLNAFDDYLGARNTLCLIKIHPLQMDKAAFHREYHNMITLTNDDLKKSGLQLYEVIGKSDALISDYSSVSNDYLLCHKPMAFLLDDMQRYSRGFVYDNVLEYMPGAHIFDTEGLYQFVDDIAEGSDKTAEFREKIMPLFHKYQDDNSSKRICDFLNL